MYILKIFGRTLAISYNLQSPDSRKLPKANREIKPKHWE